MPKTDQSCAEELTEFDFREGGALGRADFYQAETRADYYELVEYECKDSHENLFDATDACQPLAWAVQSINGRVRNELIHDLESAKARRPTTRKRKAAPKERIALMPEEPELGYEIWLLQLSTPEFKHLVAPEIQE